MEDNEELKKEISVVRGYLEEALEYTTRLDKPLSHLDSYLCSILPRITVDEIETHINVEKARCRLADLRYALFAAHNVIYKFIDDEG